MSDRVSYSLSDGVATITMDDGKVNVLGFDMQAEIRGAFDRAQADRAVVVLAGREGRFSGGFDLALINGRDPRVGEMVRGGFELAERMMAFPHPVVAACTGHAVAMGMFLVLSADYSIGANGPFRVTANEVAIGMSIPRAAVEVSRGRMTPAAVVRALNLAEVFTPEAALAAGIFDRVVEPPEVVATAQSVAAGFTQLNAAAHAATKLVARRDVLAGLRSAIGEMGPRG